MPGATRDCLLFFRVFAASAGSAGTGYVYRLLTGWCGHEGELA